MPPRHCRIPQHALGHHAGVRRRHPVVKQRLETGRIGLERRLEPRPVQPHRAVAIGRHPEIRQELRRAAKPAQRGRDDGLQIALHRLDQPIPGQGPGRSLSDAARRQRRQQGLRLVQLLDQRGHVHPRRLDVARKADRGRRPGLRRHLDAGTGDQVIDHIRRAEHVDPVHRQDRILRRLYLNRVIRGCRVKGAQPLHRRLCREPERGPRAVFADHTQRKRPVALVHQPRLHPGNAVQHLGQHRHRRPFGNVDPMHRAVRLYRETRRGPVAARHPDPGLDLQDPRPDQRIRRGEPGKLQHLPLGGLHHLDTARLIGDLGGIGDRHRHARMARRGLQHRIFPQRRHGLVQGRHLRPHLTQRRNRQFRRLLLRLLRRHQRRDLCRHKGRRQVTQVQPRPVLVQRGQNIDGHDPPFFPRQ